MSEDISKKILIEIKYKNDEAIKAINDFTAANNQSSAAIEAANLKLIEAKTLVENNKASISALRLAQLEANKATKEAKAAYQAAAGSYDEAKEKMKQLGIAIRSTEGGLKSSNIEVQKQIKEYNKLNDQLKKVDAQMGNHQRKVGEYENSLNNLSEILSKIIPGFDKFSGAVSMASQVMGFMPTAAKKAEGGITSLAKSTNNANGIFGSFSGFKQWNTGAKETEQAAAGVENAVVGAGASAVVASKGIGEMGATAVVAGEAAEGAEAGVAGLTGAVVATTAVAAVFVAVGWTVIDYLSQFASYSDGAAAKVEGLKAGWGAFITSIADGQFSKMLSNMQLASTLAEAYTINLKNLQRELIVSKTLTEEENGEVRTLMLKMRDRASSATQSEEYYREALKLTAEQYKRNHAHALDAYQLTVLSSTAKSNLSGQELKGLLDLSHGYDKAIEKAKQLVDQNRIDKDVLEKVGEALNYVISVDDEKRNRDQLLQNRNDAKQMRAEAAAEKAKEKADRLKQQAEHDISEAQKGLEEANNERQASVARMLQSQMDVFAKELSIEDEKYSQKLFKEEEFQRKMADLAAKTKSPKAKSKFNDAISASKKNEIQAENEHSADLAKVIQDNNEKTYQIVLKSDLDIKKLRNDSEDDELKRLITTEDLRLETTLDGLQKEKEVLQKSIAQNKESVKKAKGDELVALQLTLDRQKILLKDNDLAQEAETDASEKRKAKIKKDAADKAQSLNDSTSVLAAKLTDDRHPSNKNKKALLAAQEEELLNTKNREIAIVGITAAQKLNIEQKYQNDKYALELAFNEKRAQSELSLIKITQQAALSIIKNAISSNSQAKEVALQNDQRNELRNTSLTSTQKEIINEKYRIKEGQAKQKEFRTNQKLAIAEALIQGALAMLKTTANTGFPLAFAFDPIVAAQTALEVTTIAAQRPPAYATGGLHYKSDGRGSLLNGPGSGKSDSMNARLSNGEAIINAKSTSMFGPILSAINQAGGGVPFGNRPQTQWFSPAFATGGMFNTYLPTADNGLRQSNPGSPMRLHGDDINSVISGFTGALMHMPRPITDVKDVSYQQGIVSYVENKSSH